MIQFYIPWEGEGGYDENLKYNWNIDRNQKMTIECESIQLAT
jgi:hypothetical protein